MATTISARNSSIELLRIFTMASVLMGHSFGHGAHGEVSYDGLFLLWGVCINVFLLISGLLRHQSEGEIVSQSHRHGIVLPPLVKCVKYSYF